MAKAKGNQTINEAAGKIGAMLGRIAAKVDNVKRQRAEISAELDHVISVAMKMKSDIGAAGPDLRRAGKTVASAMGTARRRMSPEARERIANAARKRWVAYRKAKAAAKK